MVVALLLTAVGVVLLAILLRGHAPRAHSADMPPAPLPGQPPHFREFARTSGSEEPGRASKSAILALNSLGTTRVRPGHRTIEEVRRRCSEDFAGALSFLEGQLNRRISDNPLEQSRYWMDMAEGVRSMNLHEAMPALLRRADDALSLPLGEGYAAELVCFSSFPEFLHDPLSAEGQAGLKILRSAMESVRCGRLPMSVYAESAFGDAVRRLTENCPDAANPRLVGAFVEALRHGRRAFHSHSVFRDDPVRRQSVRWQQAYLRDAEPVMREYLHDISADMVRMLETSRGRGRLEILAALHELKADTDESLLSLLSEPSVEHRSAVISCLRWSKSPSVANVLCGIVSHAVGGDRAARRLRRFGFGKTPIAGDELLAAIQSLRGHPGEAAEIALLKFLSAATGEWRRAAIQSLGWWEPIRRSDVLAVIRQARLDHHPDVRRAALAASARLGECGALQILRESLNRDNPRFVGDTIRLCADEGLSWMWPELDALTESDDPTIAVDAWEAIERLREEFLTNP